MKISSFRRETSLLVFDDLVVMCLSSVRQGVVGEDRALMLHMHIGHPPICIIKDLLSLYVWRNRGF